MLWLSSSAEIIVLPPSTSTQLPVNICTCVRRHKKKNDYIEANYRDPRKSGMCLLEELEQAYHILQVWYCCLQCWLTGEEGSGSDSHEEVQFFLERSERKPKTSSLSLCSYLSFWRNSTILWQKTGNVKAKEKSEICYPPAFDRERWLLCLFQILFAEGKEISKSYWLKLHCIHCK